MLVTLPNRLIVITGCCFCMRKKIPFTSLSLNVLFTFQQFFFSLYCLSLSLSLSILSDTINWRERNRVWSDYKELKWREKRWWRAWRQTSINHESSSWFSFVKHLAKEKLKQGKYIWRNEMVDWKERDMIVRRIKLKRERTRTTNNHSPSTLLDESFEKRMDKVEKKEIDGNRFWELNQWPPS